jgi:L-aminopeptidase/D-esterase-like protein
LGRVGTISSNFSGDIFLAFSTANPNAANPEVITQVKILPNDQINPVFEAVVQATEEAIINAICAAETTIGRDNFKVIAIPNDRLKAALKKYGRLPEDNET